MRGTSQGQVEGYVSDFKTGEYFPGYGIYGNGTYMSNHRGTARSYAGGYENGTMDILVSPDARLISSVKLRQLMYQLSAADRHDALGDPGRFAAVLGYDGILKDVSGGEFYLVLLNRTALAVLK